MALNVQWFESKNEINKNHDITTAEVCKDAASKNVITLFCVFHYSDNLFC